MRSLISLKPEVRVSRVAIMLLSIPVAIICLAIFAGVAMRCLGYEDKTVQIGMSTERVRILLGDPDHVATLELANGQLREDWWYSHLPVDAKSDYRQLAFESGRLVSNHSKNHLPK